MKKIIVLLLTINSTYSQILFEENFLLDLDSPYYSQWVLIDNDGLTPNAQVSYIDTAWITVYDDSADYDLCAASNSWYDPEGIADDWMITKPIAIPENFNAELSWNVKSKNEFFRDSYQVLISTSGNTIGDFIDPAEWTESAAPADWTTRTLDLSAYNNQTIYIAWRNNSNNKYILQIDSVKVEKNTTLSVQENQMNNNFITVYPNPSSDYIIISGLSKNETYSIYNVLGVQIISGIASDKQKLNIRNLTEGFYILKFDNRKTIKFIKK